jgi:5,10-methylenetetrahydromethanopterin reductase
VLLTSGLSLRQVKLAVENVRIGVGRIGRDFSNVDVACYIPSCISHGGRIDSVAAKAYLAHVLAHSSEESLNLDGVDLGDVVSIRQAVNRGRSREAAHLVRDEILEIYTASGSPERICERIREYRSSGVTLPIVCPTGSQIKGIIQASSQIIRSDAQASHD